MFLWPLKGLMYRRLGHLTPTKEILMALKLIKLNVTGIKDCNEIFLHEGCVFLIDFCIGYFDKLISCYLFKFGPVISCFIIPKCILYNWNRPHELIKQTICSFNDPFRRNLLIRLKNDMSRQCVT